MTRYEKRYLVKLAIGLAIEIPLLLWYVDAQPFGMWTTPVAAIAIGFIGLAWTLIFEV